MGRALGMINVDTGTAGVSPALLPYKRLLGKLKSVCDAAGGTPAVPIFVIPVFPTPPRRATNHYHSLVAVVSLRSLARVSDM